MNIQGLTQDFNFSATLAHPLAKAGLVEMLPTAWVKALANPAPSETTDITPGSSTLVGMEELWQHLQDHGMNDPFILSAGRVDGLARLEAGNHRINLFSENGIDYVPATVLVGDLAVLFDGNGAHSFKRELIIPAQTHKNAPYDERLYMAPSDVFAEIKDMKAQGQLPRI